MRILATGADLLFATELTQFLEAAGFLVVGAEDHDAGPADSIVALLSPAAMDDPWWLDQVAATDGHRFVPVQLGPVHLPEREDLERLRTINWIQPQPGPAHTTFSLVMAVLQSQPERYTARRQLTLQTEAWLRGGRSPDLLVDDHAHGRELADLLTDLADDPLLRPSPAEVAFVRSSQQAGRSRRSKSWRRRVVATVAILAAVAAAASAVPSIRQLGRKNFSSIGVSTTPYMNALQPAWAAVLASSLLIDGDAAERDLARQSLRDLLGERWGDGDIYPTIFDALDFAVPFGDGDLVAILFRNGDTSSFGFYDQGKQELQWSIQLEGPWYGLDIVDDGRTAVIVGDEGVAIVDTASRSVRPVEVGEARPNVVQLEQTGRRAGLASWDGDLWTLDLDEARLEPLDGFDEVYDLRAGTGGAGGVRAAVATADDGYALVDALDGRVLARMEEPGVAAPKATVVPDRDQAILLGADHQLWRFGVDQEPEPLGIAAPDLTGRLVALTGDRVALGGQVAPVHVRSTASGADLGAICTGTHRFAGLRPSRSTSRVACNGNFSTEIWPTPSGPVDPPAEPLAHDLRVEVAGRTIVAERNGVEVLRPAADGGDLPWRRLTVGDIVAMAVSPDGTQVLVATDQARVSIYDTSSPELPIVVDWIVPDGSPVTAAGWTPAPLVATANGDHWAAPTCPRCGTDEGLLDVVADRLYPCWSRTQLQSIDGGTRRRLGIDACN